MLLDWRRGQLQPKMSNVIFLKKPEMSCALPERKDKLLS